jgi:hypothetical protein
MELLLVYDIRREVKAFNGDRLLIIYNASNNYRLTITNNLRRYCKLSGVKSYAYTISDTLTRAI